MHFGDDDRGVSIVVGAVLLFAVLVVSFSLYQANAVPDQNAEVEFKHSVHVTNQLVGVRNAILTAAESGVDGYVTVDLGVQYPPRVLAINPPAAVGTVRTGEAKPIVVRDGSGRDVSDSVCPGTPETRLVTYEAGYHAYQNGPETTYEHSVIYNRFGEATIPLSGQTLVRGDDVDLTLLRAAYRRSGVGAISFDVEAGRQTTSTVADPTLTLPTKLSEADWEELLAREVPAGNVSVADGNLTVSLSGTYTVNCAGVGLGQDLPGDRREVASDDINPVSPGSVQLSDARLVNGSSKDDDVLVELQNTADRSATIRQARISFFFDSHETGNAPVTEVALRNETGGNVSAVLQIQDGAKALDPQIGLPGNDTSTVYFGFDEVVSHDDFFVVYLTFADGRTGQYFVTPRSAS